MNDFTKEELKELLASTFLIDENYKQEFMDNLRIKMLFMIDNYCEHKEFTYDPMGGHFDDRICKKCGKQERCCK